MVARVSGRGGLLRDELASSEASKPVKIDNKNEAFTMAFLRKKGGPSPFEPFRQESFQAGRLQLICPREDQLALSVPIRRTPFVRVNQCN